MNNNNTSIKKKQPRLVRWLKSKRFWKRLFIITFLVPLLLFSTVITVVYWKQDSIVQHLIKNMNKDFTGMIEISGSHISPFEAFPYTSIDLEHVKVYETKEKNSTPIVDVEEVFLGFDIWTILNGNMEIKEIILKRGNLNLIQHVDGEFNITKALTTTSEIEDPNEEFHLDLHEIILEEIDLKKLNEANNVTVEAYINDADSKFRTAPDHVYASLDSRFELNIIRGNDTTFIKHKHFDVNTEFDFLKGDDIMTIQPTVVKLEGSEFNMEGTIDFLKDALLDIHFNGNKENFELVMSMAPEEILPILNKYQNSGNIFFDATIKGPAMNGGKPAIEATFGCKNAYFNNQSVNRKLDDLNFVGHFTNGRERSPRTMELTISDFSAKPEVGEVSANLTVSNFDDPEIDLNLNSNFELPFLADFFNLTNLNDMHGSINLEMNFHDIINLENPEHSVKKLNESYYTKLVVKDLSFISSNYGVPVKDIDIHAEVIGHEAIIDYVNIKMGNSDVSINGTISDLPAIMHHTNIPIDTRLNIKSTFLDLFELTGSDPEKSVNEQIENLSLDLDFKSSAKAITESPNLPIGEFFIENFNAKLKHYPHAFHDFHADVIIQEEDLKLIDFKGMIDKSDFLFTGGVSHYDLWLSEHPKGDTKIEFNLTSDMLKLEDVFSYKKENYVPEDYRHEEFDKLKIHGFTDLHFNEGLRSIDTYLDKFTAKMKVHHLRFEDFNGRVHYEDEHLVVEEFSGKLGKSDFQTTLHWYLGEDENIKKRDNHFEIVSKRLDFDQLFEYHIPETSDTNVDHDAGFNIYNLPFTDMTYDIKIDHLNYHKYLLHNFDAKMHTTPDHYIHLDKIGLDAAGGTWNIKGYFNGSNPDLIYFSPDMNLEGVDLDKLLFKFDNFGQDHLVSENLHGKFSGNITGKIHMHNDLVPKIDDSEIHMDVNVLNGKLENYKLLEVVADYFKDKNLSSVRFDTLKNHIDMKNGVLTIPNMTVNSSLGFMDIEGKQNTNFDFEFYIRIPWKMMTQTASSKLFGKKPEQVDPDQVDAIQYANDNKKTRYVNLKITGNSDDYKISLGKKKKEKRKKKKNKGSTTANND